MRKRKKRRKARRSNVAAPVPCKPGEKRPLLSATRNIPNRDITNIPSWHNTVKGVIGYFQITAASKGKRDHAAKISDGLKYDAEHGQPLRKRTTHGGLSNLDRVCGLLSRFCRLSSRQDARPRSEAVTRASRAASCIFAPIAPLQQETLSYPGFGCDSVSLLY